MLRGQLINIVTARSVGCKVARRRKAEVDHAIAFGKDHAAMNAMIDQFGAKLILAEIERVLGKRAIAASGLASYLLTCMVIVCDIPESLVRSAHRAIVDYQHIVGRKIVEQGGQSIFEQR